jgi:predicted NBD/HSP70 family sugar kinase
MSKLILEVPHSLDQEEATRRLKEKFAAALAEHHGDVSPIRNEWKDHTFSFAFQALGMAVSGTVAVEHKAVKLAAELPFAAMLFKRAIEERLRKEVDAVLA